MQDLDYYINMSLFLLSNNPSSIIVIYWKQDAYISVELSLCAGKVGMGYRFGVFDAIEDVFFSLAVQQLIDLAPKLVRALFE